MTRDELIETLSKSNEKKIITIKNETFRGEDLTDISFDGCHLMNCLFLRCDLTGSNFSHCVMNNINFDLCSLVCCNFSLSNISTFWFNKCEMYCVILDHSVLKYGGFCDCEITNSDFTQTHQHEVSYTRGYIADSDMVFCDLIDIAFYNTVLKKVLFEDSTYHHITMDEVTLHDTDVDCIDPDELIVYGGFDKEETKEFAVHLIVNTKSEATVTLVEEV